MSEECAQVPRGGCKTVNPGKPFGGWHNRSCVGRRTRAQVTHNPHCIQFAWALQSDFVFNTSPDPHWFIVSSEFELDFVFISGQICVYNRYIYSHTFHVAIFSNSPVSQWCSCAAVLFVAICFWRGLMGWACMCRTVMGAWIATNWQMWSRAA